MSPLATKTCLGVAPWPPRRESGLGVAPGHQDVLRCRPLATKTWVRLRCRPWPPRRDFGDTPLSIECFSHLPIRSSYHESVGPLWKKDWITILTKNGVGIYTPLHGQKSSGSHIQFRVVFSLLDIFKQNLIDMCYQKRSTLLQNITKLTNHWRVISKRLRGRGLRFWSTW